MFTIMLPDDLLGQAILLSQHDDEHVRATHVPTSIQHNLDVNGCFENYQIPTIGCNCHANHIDLSKQEVLEEEIGEQFWVKNIVTDHQALKPGDYACKESLPIPMVTWEDGDKTNGIPHLADIPYLIGKDHLVIVVLYTDTNKQSELDASKKAVADIVAQYLPVDCLPQWLLSLQESGIIDDLQWPVPPDNSDCLLENSTVLMEKPGLDIEKGFDGLYSTPTPMTDKDIKPALPHSPQQPTDIKIHPVTHQ